MPQKHLVHGDMFDIHVKQNMNLGSIVNCSDHQTEADLRKDSGGRNFISAALCLSTTYGTNKQ